MKARPIIGSSSYVWVTSNRLSAPVPLTSLTFGPNFEVYEVKGKMIRELVPGQLSEPGGVSIGKDGSIYVTDGAIGAFQNHGRLLKIRGS